MNFFFHPEAEEEFNKAIDYYEEIESGLGYDFALEVYSTIKRSVEFPKVWAVFKGDVRRSLVRRLSVWDSVFGGTRWIVHRCRDESAS